MTGRALWDADLFDGLPPASFWDWDDAIRYARASSHVHRRRMRVTGGALGAWTVRMA